MIENILLFAIVEFALSISPGPAILLIVSQALSKGFRYSIFCIVGILSANLLYFILSAFGLGTVISENANIFGTIKIVGAIYLLWLSLEAAVELFSAKNKLNNGFNNDNYGQIAVTHNKSALLKGLLIQLSSIKNLLIFLSVVPQFIDSSQPVFPQFLLLGLISIFVELPILLFYAYYASKISLRFSNKRIKFLFSLFSILVLVTLALFILFR